MKMFFLLMTLTIPTLSFATGGISCKDLQGGQLEILTDEASMGGDNLIGVNLKVGNRSLQLTTSSVSRDDYPNTIYMASDSEGNILTLIKDVTTIKIGRKNVKVSKALIRLSDRSILQENVVCEH